MRYVATAVPGLGSLLSEQLGDLARATGAEVIGNDGRNDLVAVTVRGELPIPDLRCAEDIFVAVAEVRRPRGLHSMIESLTRPEGMERALSAYANHAKPLRPRMGYRVISRILSERDFLRTTLRDELSKHIGGQHPRWIEADPGQLEFWVLEVKPAHFVLCLRLTRGDFRQRGGRAEERPGALRPSIAAAMVRLAGAAGDEAVLLDPCCGSGTILMEAGAAGWSSVVGSDIDPEAVRIARRNVQAANVSRRDARTLGLVTGSVDAVVSNLPFGGRFSVPGDPRKWLQAVIDECVRVIRPGGRMVVLTASGKVTANIIHRHAGLALERAIDVRVLGVSATIWAARVTDQAG